MKKSGSSSSGINTNQFMKGNETYLQDTERFVLSGFFSCLLRTRTEEKTETESYMSQGTASASTAVLWLLHYFHVSTKKGINLRN